MQSEITRVVDDYERGRLSRRQLIAHLTGMAAAAAALPAGARAQSGPKAAASHRPTFAGTDVNHIALRVTDIERSSAFYQTHLGLEVASTSPSSCFLRCREKNFLALFHHEKPGMDHYCFSVEKYEAGDAVKRLEAVGLAPRRRGNRVYFDDPDGIEVQVAAKTHGV
jgi:catechol 2,3-dioxygenase-like lactoylglutathione lyase family enzyme